MPNLKFKNSKIQKLFFLPYFFLISFISLSQITQELPQFIIQGAVKLKGKPIDGVALELSKDGKQISKLITRKNGMYSFQMDKSTSSNESDYVINVVKEGTVTGVLRINTYSIAKDGFDNVPYIYNLDIELILPASSGDKTKHDFGKIKLNSDRGVFDFDKDYVATVEKEKVKEKVKEKNVVKVDSSKDEPDDFDKEYSKMMAKAKDKVKGDSSKSQVGVPDKKIKEKNNIKNNVDGETKKKPDIAVVQKSGNKESTTKNTLLKDPTQKKEITQLPEKKETSAANKELAKSNGSEAKSNGFEAKAGTQKIKNNTNDDKSLVLKNPTQKDNTSVSEVKKGKETDKKRLAISDGKSLPPPNLNLKTQNSDLNPETAPQKDQFNLTRIPMGQYNTNLLFVGVGQNSFDGKNVFSVNNEKSKLISAKEKIERKKAANLAKKYETNNTLTSLLNVVDDYETQPDPAEGKVN